MLHTRQVFGLANLPPPPASCVQVLLEPTSLMLSMRLSQHATVAQSARALYKSLFAADVRLPIPTLLAHLNSELECVFSRLVYYDRSQTPGSARVATPIYHPLINKLKVDELEVLFALDMPLLAATTVRLESAVPQTFSWVVTQYPALSHASLMERPVLQLAVVSCLFQLFARYTHARLHWSSSSRFLRSSCACATHTHSLYERNQVTPAMAVQIGTLLIESMNAQCPRALRLLSLDWLLFAAVRSFARLVPGSTRASPSFPFAVTPFIDPLLCTLLDTDSDLRLGAAVLLSCLASVPATRQPLDDAGGMLEIELDASTVARICSAAFHSLSDADATVRRALLHLLGSLGPLGIRPDVGGIGLEHLESSSGRWFLPASERYCHASNARLLQRRIMNLESGAPNFRTHHFQRTMAFVSQRLDGGISDTFVRMMYASRASAALRAQAQSPTGTAPQWSAVTAQLEPAAQRFDAPLLEHAEPAAIGSTALFWALWECGRYCVEQRLRTPFGHPQETLEAIENMLLRIVPYDEDYQLQSSTASGTSGSAPPSIARAGSGPRVALQHRALRSLLQFVDMLEKQIYNAHEGSALALPPPAQAAATSFFRLNRSACVEWFMRMRQPALIASVINSSSFDVISHAHKRLGEVGYQLAEAAQKAGAANGTAGGGHRAAGKSAPSNNAVKELRRRLAPDVDYALLNLASAFAAVREPDAIEGLAAFYSSALPGSGAGGASHRHGAKPLTGCISNSHAPRMLGAYSSGTHFGPCLRALLLQAQGSYERAIDSYLALITAKPHASTSKAAGAKAKTKASSRPVVRFVVHQLTECYTQLADWDGLSNWLTLLKELRRSCTDNELSGAYVPQHELNFINALSRFDLGEPQAALHLLDLVSVLPPNSPQELVQNSRQTLLRFMCEEQLVRRSFHHGTDLAGAHEGTNDHGVQHQLQQASSLDSCFTQLEQALRVLDQSSTLAHACVMQLHCCYKLAAAAAAANGGSSAGNVRVPANFGGLDAFRHDAGAWNDVLRVQRFVSKQSRQSDVASVSDDSLLLASARLARKQGNFQLASRRMSEIVSSHSQLFVAAENAKLLYAQRRSRDAIKRLWMLKSQVLAAAGVSVMPPTSTHNRASVSVFLKLAKWLETDRHALAATGESPHDSLLHELAALTSTELDATTTSSIEQLAGRCLLEATQFNDKAAAAWLAYGSWAYRQGQRGLDAIQSRSQQVVLSLDEAARLQAVLSSCAGAPDPLDDETLTTVRKLVSRFHIDDSSSSSEVSQADEVREAVLAQLSVAVPWLDGQGREQLLEIWKSARARALQPYALATQCYTTYLSVVGAAATTTTTATAGSNRIEQGKGDDITTATLRVLRLLVKHGHDLRQWLEAGLQRTPAAPWQHIIPQLFSRLGHPEPFVAKQVLRLICRLGREFPYAVAYPAVVACSAQPVAMATIAAVAAAAAASSSSSSSKASGSTLTAATAADGLLRQQSQVIVSELREHSSRFMDEVEVLISELQRITMLWEEQWILLLDRLRHDVAARARTMRDESSRVLTNATLLEQDKRRIMLEKYRAITKPVCVALGELHTRTSAVREPQTPREQWFQHQYAGAITRALQSFENPPEAIDINEAWRAFETLAKDMSRSFKPQMALGLSEISPALTNTIGGAASAVSMPGLAAVRGAAAPVTIQSFDNAVVVLPTKTKPKRIILLGSDGNKYAYLLKGQDDLHLDERIMQILDVVNKLLLRNKHTASRQLRARKYAVIPLGARSGIIQWVEGVTPAYSVYKQWRRREAKLNAPASTASPAAGQEQQPPPPQPQPQPQQGQQATSSRALAMRPSDSFFSKLLPALKAHGVKNVTARHEWPLEIVRRVFVQLVHETPSHLLQNELWYSSPSSAVWWHKTQRFNRSVAVMSIVGYILGLGDRHLDNILVDFETGDIVHIDYNICFERGTKLRVPETVPFRLTQNMERALGVTGVEGVFRVACEHTLRVLRKNREIMLTLLEAFVYDPLVDWTIDKAAGEAQKNLELSVSLNLFVSRIDEMNVSLLQHRDSLKQQLVGLQQSLASSATTTPPPPPPLQQVAAAVRERKRLAAQFEELTSSIDALAATESQTSKALLEAQQQEVAARHKVESLRDTLKSEALRECTMWHERHKRTLEVLHGPAVQSLVAQVEATPLAELVARQRECYLAISEAVVVRDGDSSPSRMVSADEHASFMSLSLAVQPSVQRREALLRRCLEALGNYQQLVATLPVQEYAGRTYCALWMQLLTAALEADGIAVGSRVYCAASQQLTGVTGTLASLAAIEHSTSTEARRALDLACYESYRRYDSMLTERSAFLEQLLGARQLLLQSAPPPATQHHRSPPPNMTAASLSSLAAEAIGLLTTASSSCSLASSGELTGSDMCAALVRQVDPMFHVLMRPQHVVRAFILTSVLSVDEHATPQSVATSLASSIVPLDTHLSALLEACRTMLDTTRLALVPEARIALRPGTSPLAQKITHLARQIASPSVPELTPIASAASSHLETLEYHSPHVFQALAMLVHGGVLPTDADPTFPLFSRLNQLFVSLEQCCSALLASVPAPASYNAAAAAAAVSRAPQACASLLLSHRILVADAVFASACAHVADPTASPITATLDASLPKMTALMSALLRLASDVARVVVIPCVTAHFARVCEHSRSLGTEMQAASEWARDAMASQMQQLAHHDKLRVISLAADEIAHEVQILRPELVRYVHYFEESLARVSGLDGRVSSSADASSNTAQQHERLIQSTLVARLQLVEALGASRQELAALEAELLASPNQAAFDGVESAIMTRLAQNHGRLAASGLLHSQAMALLEIGSSRHRIGSERAQQVQRVLALCDAIVEFESFRFISQPQTEELDANNRALLRRLMTAYEHCEAVQHTSEQLQRQHTQAADERRHAKNQVISLSKEIAVVSTRLKSAELAAAVATERQRVLAALRAIEPVIVTNGTLAKEVATLLETITKITHQLDSASHIHLLAEAVLHGQALIEQRLSSLLALQVAFAPATGALDMTALAEPIESALSLVLDDEACRALLSLIDDTYTKLLAMVQASTTAAADPTADQQPPTTAAGKPAADQGATTPTTVTSSNASNIATNASATATTATTTATTESQGDEAEDHSQTEERGGVIEEELKQRAVGLKQERNSHALNVLKRVRLKLTGRIGEHAKLSVPEQVNAVIEEAISVDNLCVMYEGWTPWI